MTKQLDDASCSPRSPLSEHHEGPLLSRTCIVIVSAMLLGIGAGHDMTNDMAAFCGFVGLFGLAAYAALQLVAHRRYADRVMATVERVHDRIAVNAAAVAHHASANSAGALPVGVVPGASELAFEIYQRRERRRRDRRHARQ